MWAQTYSLSLPEMEGLQLSISILDDVFMPFMREKRAHEAKVREAAEAARKRQDAAGRGRR